MGIMNRLRVLQTTNKKKFKRALKGKGAAVKAGDKPRAQSQDWSPPAGPYTGLECGARRAASALGLWFLVEGPPADPHWTIYSRVTGKAIMTYYPKSRHWLAGQEEGYCSGYREALGRAAGFRKCSENHNLH